MFTLRNKICSKTDKISIQTKNSMYDNIVRLL